MAYSDFSSKTKNIICRVLGIIPDGIYLKLMYRIKTGRKLSLKSPKTYSEKLNWLKMYDRNPLYTKLVDKLLVRDYVKEKIGGEYLIPLLGVWNSFDEIDFDRLPDRFVLKCTHDFGSVVMIKDKSQMNKDVVRTAINEELRYNFFYRGREWAYKNVTPRIIAEEYMDDGNLRLTDYKFFCNNGKVHAMFIASGRGSDLRFDFFDRDFNHLPIVNGVPNADILPTKPKHYNEMLSLAEALSNGINNVRVDLYEIGNKIYFSEMTFYHNGGMVAINPYEMDVEFGKSFIMKKY